jgi:hypothetical protein
MKSSLSVCPVPDEQQPLNEYQELRESWFYSWGTRNLRGYVSPIFVLWVLSWGVAGPVAAASFEPTRYTLQFVLSAAAGASIIPGLALAQLYLGWIYVRDRLYKQTITYEESGWYDGQLWTKPDTVVTRDRLLVNHEIRPILNRLQQTFGILILFVLGEGLAWGLL